MLNNRPIEFEEEARSKIKDIKSLYILYCTVGSQTSSKIGVSANPQERFLYLARNNAFTIKKYKFYMADQLDFWDKTADQIEKKVKRVFGNELSHEHSKEWFSVEPHEIKTVVDDKLLKYMKYRKQVEKFAKEFEDSLDPCYTEKGFRN